MNNNKNTILIADSDTEQTKILKKRLSLEEFRVFIVDSGRDVVAFIRKREIDIVIIDVNLTDMEGYKIIPIIKDFDKKIKVIISTSENSLELESKCRAKGIIYYAIKPLVIEEIVKIVKDALKNKLTASID